MTPYASGTLTLHHPGQQAAEWPEVRVRSRRLAVQRALNPWLLFFALVYLAWSYVHLSSSIWARFVLASYLIWRMRPDIIVPYCLTCVQLRLGLSAEVMGGVQGLDDVYAGLTGFESYAFTLPPVLMGLRTVIAMFDARVSKRAFANVAGGAWLVAGLLVIAGALYARANGFGWTASLRMYTVVGSALYGMLMPRLDGPELKRLGGSLALLGALVSWSALYSIYNSQLVFVFGPLAAVWGVLGVVRREKPILSLIVVAVSGAFCVFCSTFMLMLTWLWCAVAGVIESSVRSTPTGSYKRLHAFILASAMLCATVFLAGFILYVGEKSEADTSLRGRIESKLYQDRGPLWVGFVQSVYDEPYFLPIPGRAFTIRSFGKDTLWRYGPHNLVLELLRQLGLICGPIAVAVLAALVIRLTRVMAYDGNRGGLAIGTAAISAILVGGVTLAFVLADRQGEVLLMAAGLVITSCWRGGGGQRQA